MEPVWNDEQDHGIGRTEKGRYLCKLRTEGTVHGWAQLSAKPADEDSDGMATATQRMGSSAALSSKGPKALHSKHLKFKILRDPTVGHHQGSVTAVKFHPISPVLVTATASGNVSLFQVCKDNTNLNQKSKDSFLQSVNFPRFCLENFDFFDGGTSILASSTNQNHLYTYDLINGKVTMLRQPIVLDSLRTRLTRLSADGSFVALLANSCDIFVFDFKTMDHLHTFRCGENVVDFCFAPFNKHILYALAVGGAVSTFDLAACSAQGSFFDQGCVRATCLSCSLSGQFIACGSNTGIVNVYDRSKISSGIAKSNSPMPAWTFDQLTTSVSFIRFNSDSQMLAFGSAIKRMSGRLANCSSGSVFQGFPAKQEHFARERLTACDFSPNSAFFSFGTKQGKIRMYQMGHSEVY